MGQQQLIQLNEFERKLVEDHIVLARTVASQRHRTAPHALDLDDLRSLAYMGLCEAASRWEMYCESRGFNSADVQYFAVYARKRIAGSILDKLRSEDWATRALREKSKRLWEAGASESLPRDELARRTGMSQQEIHEVEAGMSRAPISLNSIDMDGQDSERKVAYYPELATPLGVEQNLAVQELLANFADAVLQLPKTNQILVALRYYQGLELKVISRVLGISDALTSQLHAESVLILLDRLKTTALLGM